MEAAYTDAAGRSDPDFVSLNNGALGGLTLTPGLYNWNSTVTINSDVMLTGNANDVYVFQIAGDLLQAANTQVSKSATLQAKNIFWQVCPPPLS